MKTIIHMLVTLTFIGVISGGLLSQLSGWADPLIAEHRQKETEAAIFEVQPNAKNYEKVSNVTFELYKVTDQEGKELGYALPYEGNGFQGKIRLMVGVTADLNQVVGLRVLEQVETPGLGTKIVTDPSDKANPEWFPGQFNGVITSPEITVVKNAKPSKDSEIMAITGATISSKAVVAIINSGINELRSLKGEAN